MRKKILWLLAAANLVVGAVLVGPVAGSAQEPIQPEGGEGGVYDCCKKSTSGAGFCCAHCCWNPVAPTCKASSECP